jgi:hypothetical protein
MTRGALEATINWLALEREHGKHALVPPRSGSRRTNRLERFDPKSELALGE